MSETTTQFAGQHVTVRQWSPAKPVEKWGAIRYRHRIAILVDDNYRMFSYYGSVFDYRDKRDMLDKMGLVSAFHCVIGYALTSINGNATPDIMRMCAEMKRRLNELGSSDDDLYKVEAELIDRS